MGMYLYFGLIIFLLSEMKCTRNKLYNFTTGVFLFFRGAIYGQCFASHFLVSGGAAA